MTSKNAPCPCRSGKLAKRCCMNAVGNLYKPRAALLTGDINKQHQNCYLRFLGGCSTKISREHLVTNSISKKIAEAEPDYPRRKHRFDGEALRNDFALATVAKVLCTHHNSMLGGFFDPVGLLVFNAVQSATRDEPPAETLVNGHDLEGFVVQRLCAYHFGGLLSFNNISVRDYDISPELLQAAFGELPAPPAYGLIVGPAPKFAATRGTEIAPFVSPPLREIVGGRYSLGVVGLSLNILVRSDEGDNDYRPRSIEITSVSGHIHRIILSWDADVGRGPISKWNITEPQI